MAWIEPVSTVVTAASLANEVAKSSNFIRKYASRLLYKIRHGNAVIPVFGAGGVGKSTVGKILVGEDPLDISAPYDESWLQEDMDLIGDVPGQLLIAPGQKERIDRHWPKLISKVVAGKSFGIINVVAYGYSSFAIQSYREHDLYTKDMTTKEFLGVYTEKRRQIEIEVLEKLINALLGASRPLWMITLVNKQDLWWSEKERVRAHYEHGEYNKHILRLRHSIGETHFQHEYIPASLALDNFISPSGELLAPTTAGYDLSLHLRYLQTLFSKAHELISQGAP